MGDDDKGLLEDLIGDSLEGMKDADPNLGSQGPTDFFDDGGGPGGDEDSQIIGELGGRKRSNKSNKLLIVLSIFLILSGIFAVSYRMKWIKIPYPKFLYNPPKEIKIADVKLPEGMIPKKYQNVDLNKVSQVPNQPKNQSPLKEEVDSTQKAVKDPNQKIETNPNLSTAKPTQKVPEKKPEENILQRTAKEVMPTVDAPKTNPNANLQKNTVTTPAASKLVSPVVKEPPKGAAVTEPKATTPNVPIVNAPTKTTTTLAPKTVTPPSVPQKPSAPTVAAIPSEEQGDYRIQVGAYLFESSLKGPKQKLEQLGFIPEVGPTKRQISMNRVLVGNFEQKETAEAAVKDLAEEGIKANVVQKENGFYSALTGSYFYKKTAEKEQLKLEEFGYDVVIDQAKVLTDMKELHFGSYSNKQAAQADIERLQTVGLKGVAVKK